MNSVSNCPCCDSKSLRNARALVAPFIAHRIWGRPPFEVNLATCVECEFSFFNPQLEPDEEARLYVGYRTPSYVAMRQAYEPWYTPGLNAKMTESGFLDKRKAALRDILLANLENNLARSVLDYGGAHGELVAGLIPDAAAYVYDVSQVEPVEGVQGCADLADCRRTKFDLIICSNVLEHVGRPGTLVEDMIQVAEPNTAIWIEIPIEAPFGLKLTLRRLGQEAILFLMRPRIGLSALKPGMLRLMHEHVNFFTPEALRRLLSSRGCKVLACETYRVDARIGRYRMLWAMARKQ